MKFNKSLFLILSVSVFDWGAAQLRKGSNHLNDRRRTSDDEMVEVIIGLVPEDDPDPFAPMSNKVDLEGEPIYMDSVIPEIKAGVASIPASVRTTFTDEGDEYEHVFQQFGLTVLYFVRFCR
jgi:hypothetical protein